VHAAPAALPLRMTLETGARVMVRLPDTLVVARSLDGHAEPDDASQRRCLALYRNPLSEVRIATPPSSLRLAQAALPSARSPGAAASVPRAGHERRLPQPRRGHGRSERAIWNTRPTRSCASSHPRRPPLAKDENGGGVLSSRLAIPAARPCGRAHRGDDLRR
jgi:hypothetical protein